jgi:hypothetical protein
MDTLHKSITVGPLAIFFTNVNKAMGIPGHSHYAEVTITWQTTGAIGFPVFEETVAEVKRLLQQVTDHPFRNSSNEDVAERLWEALDAFTRHRDANPVLAKWGGDYRLLSFELAVRGVPDKIGHSDGFARYRIARWLPNLEVTE